jgi:FxsC-like protein
VSGSFPPGDAARGRYPAIPATEGPLFFFSYAHSPSDDQDDTDPDVWVDKLYRDLCRHVKGLAELPKGASPGFIDRQLRQGDEWPDQLANALATCRVFVPLYSKRYFRSPHCGREWFAFAMRKVNYLSTNGGLAGAIIPALWIPLADGMLPKAASSVQYNSPDFDPLYGQHGFYGIMKVRRWQDVYDEAVYLLARRIVEASEVDPPVPPSLIPYDALSPAFGGHGDAGLGAGDKPLRITVVAPSWDELPNGRDERYYGDDFGTWNPYYGDAVRPLAAHAADVAKSLSYTPSLGDLLQHEAELMRREPPPSGPQVLLIDPYATLVRTSREILQKLDALNTPWVQVIVVWSERDLQMKEDRDRLTAALHSALPHKLTEGRAKSVSALRGTRSLEEFSRMLPPVITAAGRHYLRIASAHLPQGPPEHRELASFADQEKPQDPEEAGA